MTSNFIELYPNALSAEDCKLACERIDAIISRPDPGTSCILSDDSTRTDWNILTGSYGSLRDIEDKVLQAVVRGWRKYNALYGACSNSAYEIISPGWKFQRSEDGGGFHQWHAEQGSGRQTSNRFAVWMIYLNDVETGGRTEFKYQGVSFKPTEGTLVIWPAAFTHSHRANPDLVGKKYIATGWFNYTERNRFRETA